MNPRPLPPPVAPVDRAAWQSYGFAALMLAAALAGRWLLDPFTRDAVPLSTMTIAVAFAVWFGGWKPAALLAVAGYFAALWWFVPPRFTPKLWGEYGPLRTIIYSATCSVVIYLCESMRVARRHQAGSEAKIRSILETMRECFCAVDREWRITAVNRSAQECLAQKRDALLGQPLWQAVPGSAGSRLETELRRARETKAAVEFETNVFSPGKWHAVTASPSGDELSIFFQDITAARAHVDQLERLVDDRTAALQRVVADLETFSYTLVHDMRAPLRSIAGFAEILTLDHRHQLNAEGQRHLERIQTAAARMDRLIVDILEYSQLSRRPCELRPTDLDPIIRDILRSHADFQSAHADVAIETELPVVQGNSALLTQCFANLLQNATKFVAPGVKPRVRIRSHTVQGVARVEIADNGIGIAPEATARVFEPFRREHAHYAGTGIGLAIVQKAVEQLHGRVGVQSELGRGSQFWIELPVASLKSAPDNDARSV